MKIKIQIFLLFFALSNIAFGQRGDTHSFNFKVKFEKSIPVENLQIFYLEYSANKIKAINYKTNEQNEIIFKGENYSIAGAGNYFPTIIFSLKENKLSNYSNEKIETYKLFYLISNIETYQENISNEILFTNSNEPYYVRVDFYRDENKKKYNIEYVPLKLLSEEILEVITSNNTFVKIKKKINENDKYVNCDLFEKNEIWWNEINSETDTTKKIELIRKIIINDTIYKKYNPEIKTVSSPSINYNNIDEKGNLCGAKILFIVKFDKKKNLILDLLEQPKYVDLLNEINSENTEILLIPATEGGMAIYGQRGSSGVVFITVTDKILKRKIKKLLKNRKA